jgi:hypothetical protein
VPVGSSDAGALTGRPSSAADAESNAFAGSNSDAESGAGTAGRRDSPGSVLHPDAADAVADSGADDRTECIAECVANRPRFAGTAADRIADADAATVSTSVDGAVTRANAVSLCDKETGVLENGLARATSRNL